MSFVVIAEPDEIHAASIRAILDGVEKNFEYELVSSAEAAIDVLEHHKPDVFIGAMEMSVMTGAELFSLVEMISPETIRIVMADGRKISETVDFINECKVFKIIIKPCRLADDLLVPIGDALLERARKGQSAAKAERMRKQVKAIREEYRKTKQEWNTAAQNYGRIEKVFIDLLGFNMNLTVMSGEEAGRLRDWYAWIVRQYVKTNLEEAYIDYEKAEQLLVGYGDDPMNGQAFQIKNNCKEPMSPEQLGEISYILTLCIGCCKAVLKRYDMKVRIEEAEKAYILRLRCTFFRDWTKADKPVLYRERSEAVRKRLCAATGQAIDAFGYQSVQREKGDDTISNIAIPKKRLS